MEHETILQEATRLTGGNRQSDYGHPRRHFAKTAALWSAWKGVDFSPADVACFFMLDKLSRESNRPKRDNRVDIAGYAHCLDLVESSDPGKP